MRPNQLHYTILLKYKIIDYYIFTKTKKKKKQQKEKKIKKKVKYQLIIPDILNLKENTVPKLNQFEFPKVIKRFYKEIYILTKN